MTKAAPVYVAASSPAQTTTDALTKFWELEEPPKPDLILTSDEQKYMVSLPRKDVDLTLGDSRNQALTRYKANEKSLLNKWTWDKFQAVIQEYLDVGHAQLVSTQELTTPTSGRTSSPNNSSILPGASKWESVRCRPMMCGSSLTEEAPCRGRSQVTWGMTAAVTCCLQSFL